MRIVIGLTESREPTKAGMRIVIAAIRKPYRWSRAMWNGSTLPRVTTRRGLRTIRLMAITARRICRCSASRSDSRVVSGVMADITGIAAITGITGITDGRRVYRVESVSRTRETSYSTKQSLHCLRIKAVNLIANIILYFNDTMLREGGFHFRAAK